jgi:predicted nucleotidyltransferase
VVLANARDLDVARAYRDGTQPLRFNASDIAITLTSIEPFSKEEDDDGEEEADQG